MLEVISLSVSTHQGSATTGYGGQYPTRVIEWNLAAAGSAGSATASETTLAFIKGTVEKVEIKSATCRSGATIQIYEASSSLTTKDMPVNYTTGGTSLDVHYYPRKLTVLNTGSETTDTYDGTRVVKNYEKYVVSSTLTCAVASANADDDFEVRLFVRG